MKQKPNKKKKLTRSESENFIKQKKMKLNIHILIWEKKKRLELLDLLKQYENKWLNWTRKNWNKWEFFFGRSFVVITRNICNVYNRFFDFLVSFLVSKVDLLYFVLVDIFRKLVDGDGNIQKVLIQ